jgi:hypothetical protein
VVQGSAAFILYVCMYRYMDFNTSYSNKQYIHIFIYATSQAIRYGWGCRRKLCRSGSKLCVQVTKYRVHVLYSRMYCTYNFSPEVGEGQKLQTTGTGIVGSARWSRPKSGIFKDGYGNTRYQSICG